MKKYLIVITLLISIVILLNGCFGKNSNSAISEQNSVQSQTETQKAVEASQQTQNYELPIIQTSERPIAIMIDNEGKARKRHTGLDKAYAIYEMAAEGGETRFMALYKGTNPTAIGPVRSSRHYFIYYALEHDPIYVHFGWSPLAERTIPQLGVNNINGVKGIDGAIFWRNPNVRSDWQNAFTSIRKIKEMVARKKFRDKTNINIFKYSPNEYDLINGNKANKIDIKYSGSRHSKYVYDESNKIYKRFLGDTPHTDAISHVQYSAKNIIIAFVNNYPLNDGENKDRQQMDTVGKGEGFLVTNGKYTKITWEKKNKTAKSYYRNQSGNEIVLNQGQTWIQIVPTYQKSNFKIE